MWSTSWVAHSSSPSSAWTATTSWRTVGTPSWVHPHLVTAWLPVPPRARSTHLGGQKWVSTGRWKGWTWDVRLGKYLVCGLATVECLYGMIKLSLEFGVVYTSIMIYNSWGKLRCWSFMQERPVTWMRLITVLYCMCVCRQLCPRPFRMLRHKNRVVAGEIQHADGPLQPRLSGGQRPHLRLRGDGGQQCVGQGPQQLWGLRPQHTTVSCINIQLRTGLPKGLGLSVATGLFAVFMDVIMKGRCGEDSCLINMYWLKTVGSTTTMRRNYFIYLHVCIFILVLFGESHPSQNGNKWPSL